MKVNELRIGNYVMYEPTIDDWEEKVITLHSFLQVDISPESYCGIPLTEEWLLKFGFSWHAKNSYNLERFRYHTDKKIFSIIGRFEDLVEGLEYVHQLQNLYFALTGEELTLKERQDV